jgi:hypothetical protein
MIKTKRQPSIDRQNTIMSSKFHYLFGFAGFKRRYYFIKIKYKLNDDNN